MAGEARCAVSMARMRACSTDPLAVSRTSQRSADSSTEVGGAMVDG